MQSKAKMESLQAIIDMMDGLMLKHAKGKRKPAVVEATVEVEPAAEDKKASEDDLDENDAKSLAEFYSCDDEPKK